MKWFRFYHEAYRNPKVQDMRPELFKFWINFLCVASESEDRGTIRSEAHLRLALGLTKPSLNRYCSELEAMGLLVRNSDGSLTPHDWHDLQPESDDAARRKREQRARTCVDVPAEMSRDMSRDKNVTVTPHARGDKDIESEGDGENEFVCVTRTRDGDDLRDWREAIAELQGDPGSKLIAGMLQESESVPSVAQLEAWRFIHAAHVIQPPGRPKRWEYFLSVARRASRRDFDAWHEPPAKDEPATVRASPASKPTGRTPVPSKQDSDSLAAKLQAAKDQTAKGGQDHGRHRMAQ